MAQVNIENLKYNGTNIDKVVVNDKVVFQTGGLGFSSSVPEQYRDYFYAKLEFRAVNNQLYAYINFYTYQSSGTPPSYYLPTGLTLSFRARARYSQSSYTSDFGCTLNIPAGSAYFNSVVRPDSSVPAYFEEINITLVSSDTNNVLYELYSPIRTSENPVLMTIRPKRRNLYINN